MTKRGRSIVTALFLLLSMLLATRVRAADVSVNPTGPTYPITNLKWGCSGSGCFNNNFWFSPLYSSGAICIYVYNNNTSNSHTFTAQITYSGNPANQTPSDGSWNSYASPVNLTADTAPGTAGVIGAATSGAVLISVNLSASATQSGSPDTANVIIEQTQNGNCMVTGSGARSFFSGTLQSDATGTGQSPAIQTISDNISQSFTSGITITNPTSGYVLLNINDNASSKSIYFHQLIISSTVAASINIEGSQTTGTGCSNIGSYNLKISSAVTGVATANYSCSGSPSGVAPIGIYNVPANGSLTINLDGVVLPSGTNAGVYITAFAGVTGNVSTQMFWYEK